MAQSQTLICFVTIAMILKSSFLLVFFNINVANFKNLRLLLNRCQSLCQKARAQKGFVCVLIKLLYKACPSMSKHVVSENGPLVLILKSYSQIFIVKRID